MISFYTRALLLFRRPPCWKKHGAAGTTQQVTARHVTTRTTRHVCRVVTWRDATNGIWALRDTDCIRMEHDHPVIV